MRLLDWSSLAVDLIVSCVYYILHKRGHLPVDKSVRYHEKMDVLLGNLTEAPLLSQEERHSLKTIIPRIKCGTATVEEAEEAKEILESLAFRCQCEIWNLRREFKKEFGLGG